MKFGQIGYIHLHPLLSNHHSNSIIVSKRNLSVSAIPFLSPSTSLISIILFSISNLSIFLFFPYRRPAHKSHFGQIGQMKLKLSFVWFTTFLCCTVVTRHKRLLKLLFDDEKLIEQLNNETNKAHQHYYVIIQICL